VLGHVARHGASGRLFLPPLGQHLLGVTIALDTHHTGHVPNIDPKTATCRHADDYMNDRTTRIYPGLVPRPF